MSVFLAMLCASCSPIAEPVPIPAACTVTDGDTVRCGDERVRLLAIDAPELPGHCRAGRRCAPGDPVAATDSLRAAMQSGPIRIIRMGRDRYGRTLGSVYAGEVNLSCLQIQTGNAVYVRRWDDGKVIAKTCPEITGEGSPPG
ncbi:thermonuclease family protein [Qipengyuania sp.]|uniref:thermonuclease family protein n=1 Tax=Qipengyuania sp. TaxID=2004515 RepID=UPI0035C82606